MKLRVASSDSAWARAASDWVAERVAALEVQHLGPVRIFLPAGGTPIPLYALWEAERPAWLARCRLLQLDEVLGAPVDAPFARFFAKHLPSYQESFVPLDPESPEAPHAELALLGIGPNGHVAFHEPGLPASFTYGCVKLSAESRHALGAVGHEVLWGLSIGLAQLQRVNSVLLLARGSSKRTIVTRLLGASSKDGPNFPAAQLHEHPRLTILADHAAAPLTRSKKKGESP